MVARPQPVVGGRASGRWRNKAVTSRGELRAGHASYDFRQTPDPLPSDGRGRVRASLLPIPQTAQYIESMDAVSGVQTGLESERSADGPPLAAVRAQ